MPRSGPLDLASLADALGIPERKLQEIVGKLVGAGLLRRDLTLDRDALRAVAQSLPKDAPIDPELIAQGWSDEEARTLSKFFTGSRLKQIPTQHAKRLVVLERLAQEFEPGRRYQEKGSRLHPPAVLRRLRHVAPLPHRRAAHDPRRRRLLAQRWPLPGNPIGVAVSLWQP